MNTTTFLLACVYGLPLLFIVLYLLQKNKNPGYSNPVSIAIRKIIAWFIILTGVVFLVFGALAFLKSIIEPPISGLVGGGYGFALAIVALIFGSVFFGIGRTYLGEIKKKKELYR